MTGVEVNSASSRRALWGAGRMVSRASIVPSGEWRTELKSTTGAPLELYPDSDPSHILNADPHENYELLKREWGDYLEEVPGAGGDKANGQLQLQCG